QAGDARNRAQDYRAAVRQRRRAGRRRYPQRRVPQPGEMIMPIRLDNGDALDDGEFPEPDEQPETMLCPHCRVAIFDGAVRCPHCGAYLSEEDEDSQRKPWWIVAGALAGLAVVYLWLRHPW